VAVTGRRERTTGALTGGETVTVHPPTEDRPAPAPFTPVVVASPAAPPAGYPREFERPLTLADGRAVLVRPIVPADQDALAHAFRTADADTLRRRFLGIPPSPTPELLAHLCTVDYRQRFALVAVDAATGHGVAVARYETTGPGVAEVAVAVDPAWRRVGLATALVELLAEAGLERGLHSFDATYLAGNRPVSAIVGLAGAAAGALVRQGVAEVEVDLDPERVGEAVHRLEAPPRQG
jgi:RimJ/RimL family protein N-acetyltransferase